MESTTLAQLGGSMRRFGLEEGSPSWRSPSTRREEDDNEDLVWAALEKLPTYSRMRRGILSETQGEKEEIEVQSLGMKERRRLLDRLVGVAEENNERFLLKIKRRMDRVGIQNPTIEVRFENLSLSAEAYTGRRGIPTVFNHFVNKIEEYLSFVHLVRSGKRTVPILSDLSGIIKPYRMTLLLGPPRCGKTSLLLALSGKLNSTQKLSGRVTYNGHSMNEFVPQRTSAYISQDDVHIPEMTVRETLSFSARCQGIGARYGMLMELVRRENAAGIKPDPDIDLYMKASSLKGQEDVVTDYILKILGLETCADNMIGDAMSRGISGGQKKRVTTGEMLVGPAKALFMDEISTGLDSLTTFQIVDSLRQFVHILGGTALIALLQPAPETYELFDDIILLSEGHIVYQGPRENVLEFFESLGFKCPERKGVADFLQEVMSMKDQQQYWANKEQTHHFISVTEFVESFRVFHIGQKLQDELSTPFDRRNNHPASLTKTRYGIGKMELLKVCMSREYLLMKRNSFVYIVRLMKSLMLAFTIMTVFFRTKMHHDTVDDGLLYLGVMYVSILSHWFNGFPELAMTVTKLPIFFKQRNFLFFPAWAYTLPTCILKIPISFLECAVWIGVTYYVVGFEPNVKRMLCQYIVFTLVSQMAVSFFRLLAALGREMVIASTFVAFTQTMLIALGGYILSRDKVMKWWVWGYWSSPFMYATNALAVNEFLGNSWSHVPNMFSDGESLGVLVLRHRGLFPESYWYWIGVGALITYITVFNCLFTLTLVYINPIGKGKTVPLEALKENHMNTTIENFDSSPSREKDFSFPDNAGSTIESIVNRKKKQGMVLPFSPHSITFEDLKYSIDIPKEMKDQDNMEERLFLLNGLTGAFLPGVLTALMGASGAGKTTLMDVLAGRKTGGYIEGSIKLSGHPKKQETFARISGYCEQTDIHSPNITVYESILYSAWLRLDPDVNTTTRKLFIEEVMELLELKDLSDGIVGLPGVSGLSTEQRKRLTIAVELIANPSIIFMDEPTSGLDARAAAIVMRTVRNTVDTGRTVVCTIHQPSIDIFETFDELFLMKRGGQEIYVGPLGRHSCNLIQYFESIKGVNKIKDGYNPATWMLEVTTSFQEETLGVEFAEVYKKSELFKRNRALVTNLSRPRPESKELFFHTQYPQHFLVQFMICLWKQYKSYWRNPTYSATRIFFTTIIALLYGSMFWRVGANIKTEQDLFNAMGSMFSAVIFLGVQNCQTVQPVVAIERTVFYREKAAGMYSALPYAFAQVVVELPYVLLQAIIYGSIAYSAIGFEWTMVKFLWYLFFVFTGLLYFTIYGMMMVAVTPSMNIAAVAASLFFGLWNLFAGFVIPRPRIPIWWAWYYWACPVSYTVYGLFASQFGNVKDILDTGESIEKFVSRYFGVEYDFRRNVATIIVGFILSFILIFAYAIKSCNFQRR